MKQLLFIVFIILLALAPLKVRATHIVGGEMYYEHISGNMYKITLIVYRDCFNGIPGFDDPAYVAVFDSAFNRIKNITVPAPLPDIIPLQNYDSCTWVDTVCYEVAKYEFIDSFPPIKGGYILAYDRCCWNFSVINIVNPDERGLTIVSYIPDSSKALNNSSPVFKFRTPVFFCVNDFFEFDHSATDSDGDSLSYELFTPFNSSKLFQSHLAPNKGPYNELIYIPGFSLANVLGGKVPLKIDSTTGFMTATHGNQIGQYVFGVRVNEYRDGILIGKTERTYQINSQQCRRFTKAQFNNPIIQCGDSLVVFTNNSDSSISYLWRFGDSGSPDSISSIESPTHLYSSLGTYEVELIAYSYQGNECNDTIKGNIHLLPKLEGEFIWQEDKCSNFVQFEDVTISLSGAVNKWQWDFGDGSGAIVKNPYHYFELNDVPKSYLVTLLISNENGCEDSISLLYTGENRKYEISSPVATKYTIYPREDSTLLSVEADSAIFYSWTPVDDLSSPSENTTYAKPQVHTVYKVVVKDGRGCVAEKFVEIDVFKYGCGETSVFVPNAFSPNSDGENDFLRIRGEEITSLNLSVYNRWGQLVFESENVNMIQDQSFGWDGRFNGEIQDPGVYVYTIDVTCSDNRSFSKKGNVTLIR